MERSLATRLDERSANYEASLYRKLAQLAKDYVQSGKNTLDYFLPDFDATNDMVNCYAPISKSDFEKIERNAPQNFIHPMSATEIATLATFISQILFGGETTRSVTPRSDEDEAKADMMNALLAWNDSQQETYKQGYLWCWDSLTFNRGVMYDHWSEMFEVELEEVEQELPYEPKIDEATGKKLRKPKDWKPEKTVRWRKVRKPVGGFCKIDLISPYDFICDPTISLSNFQIGRFAGHRVVIPWQELKRRSELPVDNYEYVLPSVVEKLKTGKGRKQFVEMAANATSTSRSYFERTRRGQPMATVTGTEKANKEDGGSVECWSIIVREKPKTYDIYEDDTLELIELLFAGETDLLSVNVLTNKHDQYPYAVGEARPNAHQQFSPSCALVIKPIQDYVDYLKKRHQESIARTSGNIFIGDPTAVDFGAFTDPNKDGLFIPLTDNSQGRPIDQIIKQVAVTDTTANFHKEMEMWIQHAEVATGAHAFVQGQTEDASQTATQFVGVQQMATGRISSIARLLSVSALVPQTKRIIANLQQFMPDQITVKIVGGDLEEGGDEKPKRFKTIIRDKTAFEENDPRSLMEDIQGSFDVVPHDGSLPGADAKIVAASSRILEVAASNPMLAQQFDPTIPGSIDLGAVFRFVMKKSGVPMENFKITKEQAQKNLLAKNMAMGVFPQPSQSGAPTEEVAPGLTQPSASQLPQIPSAEPAAPSPATV